MTGDVIQAGPTTAPPEPHNDSDRVDMTKVLVPRERLLAHGRRLIAEGRTQAGNAVLTGCIGAGDLVPVSRALAERWGLVE